MTAITPITGWTLDVIVAYDEVCPGLAGHYLRASDERRQVIAAFLSNIDPDRDCQNAIGEYLSRADHRSILTRAFRHIPEGFRRALAKSGPQPHDAAYYRDLYDALSHGLSHVVTAIMRVTRLNVERLEIIKTLPSDLCDSRIIERVKDVEQAHDLIAVLDLFEERAGNRKRLVGALLASRGPLETVIRRWCRRIEYLDHPIAECVGYLPIRDGVALHEAARRYQNCSRNYSVAGLTGENAFGEFIALDGRRALLCFDKSEGAWTLEGVYARRNREVPADLAAQAREFVRDHGIRDRWNSSGSGDDIGRALRRLIQPYSQW